MAPNSKALGQVGWADATQTVNNAAVLNMMANWMPSATPVTPSTPSKVKTGVRPISLASLVSYVASQHGPLTFIYISETSTLNLHSFAQNGAILARFKRCVLPQVSGQNITVTWAGSANNAADGYRIYRAAGVSGKWTLVFTLADDAARSFTDATATRRWYRYCYKVQAYNYGKVSARSMQACRYRTK